MRFNASEMRACTLYSDKIRKFLSYAEDTLEDVILAAANNGYFSITWEPEDRWLENGEWPENLKIALRMLLADNGYKSVITRDEQMAISWEGDLDG